MNLKDIKQLIKEQWNKLPKKYKAGIAFVLIIAVIFIIT
jgi:flagellar biosynthesis/type III secretory pathway M-ring protein FliF/YscJ